MRCSQRMRVAATCASPFALDSVIQCLAPQVVPLGTVRDRVWYHLVPMSRAKENSDAAAVRGRILTAAFEVFQERGYAATSTLEIATRARVSKRELYALVGNKQK